MSLANGRNILIGEHKELMVKWELAQQKWNDPVSRELHQHYLEPLEPRIRNATGAMERLQELVSAARRDCG